MWGGPSKQEHYVAGRNLKEISRSDIDGICDCGYLTLKPTSDFESHNGGLTVKRSQVNITDEDGRVIKRLSKKGINDYGSCNACINKWC